MTPGKLPQVIYQGATWKRVVRLSSRAGPIDLTGATARMMIREKIVDAATIITLNADNARAVISDEENGEITLMIADEDTAALNFASGVYDLEIEYSNGTVDRVLYGAVKLSKEVTR